MDHDARVLDARARLEPIRDAIGRKDGTLAGELLFWADSAEFLLAEIARSTDQVATVELARGFADCVSKDLRRLADVLRDQSSS